MTATGSYNRGWAGHRLLAAAGLVGLSLVLGACQNGDPDIDISNYAASLDPADQLYNEGLANMQAGNMTEASRKFEAITKQHPYSEYGRKAMVMQTFVQYRQGQHQEAINSGKRFVNLYPNDPDAAYAQYIVGLAYFKQIPAVTRDQRPSARAIEAMNEVVERYPDSEYVDDAQAKIRYARDQLAGKEMQIGRYYLERREYVAAANRFRTVVETYPNTRQVEEALARLVETYYAMGLTSEAQTAAAVLGHNFPDSQWYADSYKLLQTGGLEPRENKGSWVSRAGKRLIGA
ncbi:outer membrane protein assembly factor BamD [Pseudohoeflea coraliihabitans]|uniref:Outer membrane protein assembly factor BamD n=1 Tax=Pseudohoeflea coraliihabitans TaxID=2860393 RepID=A0ABS6WIZ8_9HYPH|nr:outer membrane protein assembly factor BamD [Pseudohoeflea sp. DP4N28-3]MBW3095912.1 outer membrane protein assembly factor BamD [Pseudohoeflea sp. DP4N28-3]